MESGGEAHDVYVSQLREVFDSCDTSGTGKLSRAELHDLCVRLQLEDQRDQLVDQLLGTNLDARVSFDKFKEGFVSVLSESVEGLETGSEEEEDDEQDEDDLEVNQSVGHEELLRDGNGALSPKYIKGHKKYGRRSVPEGEPGWDAAADWSEDENDHHTPEGTSRNESFSRGHSPESVASYVSSTVSRNSDRVPPINVSNQVRTSGDGTRTPETFEAEGQLNQSISGMETALDPVSEEQHLKEVWRELGVGRDGYLTLNELSSVCGHIGMEEMNAEELQHLFDKLDVDGDGRVSFQEFLHGLFQHGSPSTPSTPGRPLSTPRSKLRLQMSVAGEDRMQTPSFFASGTGLFSVLDPDGTGFAKSEAIIELWESLGIPLGADIFEYLQFDTETKVNLSELSYALEQEMKGVEDDNATYQAALASCQLEMKHLKSATEHLTGERDKVKADLAEANQRIGILVKEGDERYTSMERSKEKELLNVEKKYQEQIKTLQAEIEREREVMIHQSAKQRQKLEAEIDRLKEEESKLKDKLAYTQKELEKLENEIMEMSERCSDLERLNIRQQKELDSAAELHRKLEEMESSRNMMQDEQQKFANQKLRQLEAENKELKDKIDELTMENEDLKQQVEISKRGGKSGRLESLGPKRTGSILSDYAKPNLNRSSIASDTSENSEDDNASTSGRTRRKLPRSPDDMEQTSDAEKSPRLVRRLQSELALVTKERDELRERCEEKDEELRELRAGLDLERKDIEQSFKMEITDIEDQFGQEKQDMLEAFNAEKEKLASEQAEKLTEELAAQERRLESEFEQQKQDLLIRAESEKNLREQRFAEDQLKLIDKMRDEFAEDLDSQLKEERRKHAIQLDGAFAQNESPLEDMRREKADIRVELRHKEEDLEKLKKEKSIMEKKILLHEEDLEKLSQQKRDLTKELQQREEEVETLKREKAVLEKKVNIHGDDLEKISQEKNDLERRTDVNTEEVEKLKSRKASLEKNVFDLEKKIKNQTQEVGQWKKEKSALEDSLEQLENENEDLKQEKSYLEDRLERQAEKLADLKNQVSESKSKIKALQEEIRTELERERDDFQKERDDFQIEKDKLKEERETVQKENDKLMKKFNRLEQEKETMQKENDRLLKKFGDLSSQLEGKNDTDLSKYENLFDQGERALKGKLRKDFYALLDERKAEDLMEEKTKMAEAYSKDKEELEDIHEREKADLARTHKRELSDLERQHKHTNSDLERQHKQKITDLDRQQKQKITDLERQQKQRISDLEKQLEYEREHHDRDLEVLRANLLHERDASIADKENLREAMEEELSAEIQARLELPSDVHLHLGPFSPDSSRHLPSPSPSSSSYEPNSLSTDGEFFPYNTMNTGSGKPPVKVEFSTFRESETETTRETFTTYKGNRSQKSKDAKPEASYSKVCKTNSDIIVEETRKIENDLISNTDVKICISGADIDGNTSHNVSTECGEKTGFTYFNVMASHLNDTGSSSCDTETERLEKKLYETNRLSTVLSNDNQTKCDAQQYLSTDNFIALPESENVLPRERYLGTGNMSSMKTLDIYKEMCPGSDLDSSSVTESEIDRTEKFQYFHPNGISALFACDKREQSVGLIEVSHQNGYTTSDSECEVLNSDYSKSNKARTIFAVSKQESGIGLCAISSVGACSTSNSEIERLEKRLRYGKPSRTLALVAVGKQESGMGLYTMSSIGACNTSDSETERIEKKCAGAGRMSTSVLWGKYKKDSGYYHIYGCDVKNTSFGDKSNSPEAFPEIRSKPRMGNKTLKGDAARGICALCRRPFPGPSVKPKPRIGTNSSCESGSQSETNFVQDRPGIRSLTSAHEKPKPNVRVEFSTFTESESETTKEEFVHEISRVKGAYEDERSELEARLHLLQTELEELQQNRELDDKLRGHAEKQNRDLEAKYRKQLDDLNRSNAILVQDKQKAEHLADEFKSKFRKLLDDNQNRNRDYEERLECLMVEKEEAVTAVKSERLMAPVLAPVVSHIQSDRDQAILDAIASQKDLLEAKTQELKTHIQGINRGSKPADTLQGAYNTVLAEKRSLEAAVNSMQGRMLELQERSTAADQYKGAYNNVLAEKHSLEAAVNSMQGRMQELLERSSAADQYKARLDNWESERRALKDQMQVTEDQLAEAQTALSLTQSEHVREIQGLREQNMSMVDLNRYNALQSQVLEQEQRIRELETQLEQRAAETSQLIMGTQEDHKRIVRQLQQEKETLERKLGHTSALLDEQVMKLKEQLERSDKSNLLIKELYVENSQLVVALHETEKREKQANKQVYDLEDKCQALADTVRKVCAAAMAS